MSWWKMRQRAVCAAALAIGLSGFAHLGCQDSTKVSVQHAQAHVQWLAPRVQGDVEEVRKGLPQGASHLGKLFEKARGREENAAAARAALGRARDQVQDLRVAKSTFFAVAGRDGIVIRNDQEQDRMAGRGLFEHFPKLRQALQGKYVETRGSMPEISGVKGRPDGQWVAAQPIKVEGESAGFYLTGWSWSAYAYRLEFALRSRLRSGLGEHDKLALVYVFVVVDRDVYGAPVSPVVSAKAIAELDPMSKIEQDGVFTQTLEITQRGYGLAVKGTPPLGERVGVAVLRSET